MKRSIMLYYLAAGLFLTIGCADETDRQNLPDVVDGLPVTATLSFQTADAAKATKATGEEEDRVTDLYVLVFDKDGSFAMATYFNPQQLAQAVGHKVTLQTFTGQQYIYAAANVTGNSFSSEDVHLKNRIDDFIQSTDNTLDAWKTLTAGINENQVSWPEARFLMTGYFAPDPIMGGDELSGDGLCTIRKNETTGKGEILNEGRIQLVRTVARVTFNLSTSTGVTFEPTSWQVCNVPKTVYLYKQAGPGTPGEVFHTLEDKVSNHSFDFYLLENRQTTEAVPPGNLNLYEQADWRENPQHAPEKGTYVVVKGVFKGWAPNPFNENAVENVEATVTYLIHLGYIDGVHDFTVRRNHKYTYNVKVAGIDKIIIEAIDENSPTHRANGDAIFYNAEMIDVDAHYQRVKVSFTEQDMMNEFLCGIQTAQTGFVYRNLSDVVNTPEDDTDWVLFIDKSDIDADMPNFTPGPNRTQGLMTIHQLAEKINGKHYVGSRTFYAYVAENYYNNLPKNKFINYDATSGERKSRMMMLAVKRNEGNGSSVSTAKYIIKQKPITTIYNMEDPLINQSQTFGIEWVNESLPANYAHSSFHEKAISGMSYGVSSYGSSSTDGLANMQSLIFGKIRWDSYDIKNKAYAACMSRNRDENGNGEIDQDEIKWYLPATDQYQYLWTGMQAIPEDATLYPKEFRNARIWEYYHFASSDGKVYWSQEGNAISDLTQWGEGYPDRFHVRCARNIGSGSFVDVAEKTADNGTSIVIDIQNRLTPASLRPLTHGQMGKHNEYEPNNKLYTQIQVKKELIAAGNAPYYNRPYDWMQTADAVYAAVNPCEDKYGTGWRAPNQRELILITTVGQLTDRNNGSLFSSTYYSFYNYVTNDFIAASYPGNKTKVQWNTSIRQGFSYVGVMTLGSGSNQYIRCVKDY